MQELRAAVLTSCSMWSESLYQATEAKALSASQTQSFSSLAELSADLPL